MGMNIEQFENSPERQAVQPLPIKRRLLRPREVADAIGASRSNVYAAIANGEIPHVVVSGMIRVPASWLESF
jgi:excisionase family DNA binding protein